MKLIITQRRAAASARALPRLLSLSSRMSKKIAVLPIGAAPCAVLLVGCPVSFARFFVTQSERIVIVTGSVFLSATAAASVQAWFSSAERDLIAGSCVRLTRLVTSCILFLPRECS